MCGKNTYKKKIVLKVSFVKVGSDVGCTITIILSMLPFN